MVKRISKRYWKFVERSIKNENGHKSLPVGRLLLSNSFLIFVKEKQAVRVTSSYVPI